MPEGWIVDEAGHPTTDPTRFYDGGALLTIGAHKGSGLSILTDLLAGAVTTGRSSDPDDTVLRNNMLSIFIDPKVYDRDNVVLAEARRLVDWVKSSPPVGAGAAGAGAGRRRAAHARSAAGGRSPARRQDVVRPRGRREVGRHRRGTGARVLR